MSGKQTTKLPAQAVIGQNSAALFRALDGAMNRAFDSFIHSLHGRELHNPHLITDDLAKRLDEEIGLIKMRMPDKVGVIVVPSKDKFEQLFFLKAWIRSSDFEGDTIHITRVLGFEVEFGNQKREVN